MTPEQRRIESLECNTESLIYIVKTLVWLLDEADVSVSRDRNSNVVDVHLKMNFRRLRELREALT